MVFIHRLWGRFPLEEMNKQGKQLTIILYTTPIIWYNFFWVKRSLSTYMHGVPSKQAENVLRKMLSIFCSVFLDIVHLLPVLVIL